MVSSFLRLLNFGRREPRPNAHLNEEIVVNIRKLATGICVVAASVALGTASATAAPQTPQESPINAPVVQQQNLMTSTVAAENGTLVTFTVDLTAKTLTINSQAGHEVVPIDDATVSQIRASAADSAGHVRAQKVSKQTCVNLLKGAGYANAVVWGLAAAVSSPTVAGAIVAASAGLITTAMIQEAGALCK